MYKRSIRAQKGLFTEEEYNALRKEERKKIMEDTRTLVNSRKDGMAIKSSAVGNMYGVLGIDTIVQKDEGPAIVDKKGGQDKHVYGLDHKMFTSEGQAKEWEASFNKYIKRVDAKINLSKKNLEKSGIKMIEEVNEAETQKKIKAVLDKRNKLYNKITNLTEKQSVYGEWLIDFDE